jgi:hypothetical protein
MDIQNDILKRQSQETDINIGFFKNAPEKSLYRIIKKLDKVATAVWMVAEVMPAGILPEEMKKQSLDLTSRAYQLIQQPLTKDGWMSLALCQERLKSLIQQGFITKQISLMNNEILMTTLSKIASLIHAEIEAFQPITVNLVLEDASFDVLTKQAESKRHQNDIKTTLQNDIIKKPIKIMTKSDIGEDRTDRKQEVLAVIRSRTVSTLADIKSLVKAYSEKTLQRDLNEMVEMGIIKREGNKRWTTYKMV